MSPWGCGWSACSPTTCSTSGRPRSCAGCSRAGEHGARKSEGANSVAHVSEPSTDFYAVEDLLQPEEIEIRDRVRAFCQTHVTPPITEYGERAESAFDLVPKAAELGISGGTVEGYGSPGMSAVAAGLV